MLLVVSRPAIFASVPCQRSQAVVRPTPKRTHRSFQRTPLAEGSMGYLSGTKRRSRHPIPAADQYTGLW